MGWREEREARDKSRGKPVGRCGICGQSFEHPPKPGVVEAHLWQHTSKGHV